MSLSKLIRKGGFVQIATATPATPATDEPASAPTVAKVATVAVAKPQAPSAAMTAEEEMAIRAWLAYIEEEDSDIVSEVLNQCHVAEEAREYFLRRAEMARLPTTDDDRRYCTQCVNLSLSGVCLAAFRGEIIASRTHHPADHLPRRCEGYLPRPDDFDQRPGRERWK